MNFGASGPVVARPVCLGGLTFAVESRLVFEGKSLQRCKAVLVVDDDDDVRETIADVIETAGRLVFTSHDGSEALRWLETDGIPRPCLILLDWFTFPMSGEEFIVQLRARRDAEDLRGVVMSASDAALPAAISSRILGMLRKPFGLDDVSHLLNELC